MVNSYIQDEETCIRNSTKKMLDKYYESINHEKRGLGSEALTKIGSRGLNLFSLTDSEF